MKRFDLNANEIGSRICQVMKPSNGGDWVLYKDAIKEMSMDGVTDGPDIPTKVTCRTCGSVITDSCCFKVKDYDRNNVAYFVWVECPECSHKMAQLKLKIERLESIITGYENSTQEHVHDTTTVQK